MRPGERDRKEAMEALGEAYARDWFELDEMERRMDQVHRVRDQAELRALLSDLPHDVVPPALRSGAGHPTVQQRPGAPTDEEQGAGALSRRDPSQHLPARQDRSVEVAIWSGRVRRGRWSPARKVTVVALQGGVELDFREAELEPGGVTEVFVFALMGGIEVVVPPWIRVEGNAFAFMGGYDEDDWTGVESTHGSPVVRITGFIMMGAVDVIVRYPGESKKEAKQRKREGRKRRLEEGREDAG